MQYLVAAVLAGSMALFAGSAKAADEMTIAVFTKNSTNPAYEAFRIAADQIARSTGARVLHFVPKQPDNVDEQKAMVEQVLKDRPDAVIFIPVDILAMASWPTYDPNAFTPTISAEKFKALQDDPDIPLLPRAFRSSYPPGSTFKVAVGIAALESRTVRSDEEFDCMPALQIGNTVFHNWKKTDRGPLNFVQALTESCDTWFYQVGIKTGADPILSWAQKLGFGVKCGIPLRGEVEGRVPNDQFMKATHGRKLLNGDIANLSIGQGDTQTTPLQMAQAMAIIGNGGTFYQTRLVQQVQTVDNEIVTAFQVRAKKTLDASPDTMEQLRTGMIAVVNGAGGTAHQASLENVEVAGKTGTAQWGPKTKERTAAWFAGFVPSDHPQYAFAALYEGEVGTKAHGGTAAAPMIAMILKDVYKQTTNGNKRRRTEPGDSPIPRAERVEEDESD